VENVKLNLKTWLVIVSVFVVGFVGGFYVNPLIADKTYSRADSSEVFIYNAHDNIDYLGVFPNVKPVEPPKYKFTPFASIEVDTSIPIEDIITNGILYKDGALIKVSKDEFENNESFLEWVDKNLIFCDENFQNPYLED
jgi:hypothetical protein